MPHARNHRLLSAFITILLGTMLAGCSKQVSDNIANRHLRSIAGKNATDCGQVGLHQSPTSAADCALAAWKENRPFLISYDVRGIDSKLVFGLASSGGGDVFSVKYDSMELVNR